MTKYAYSWDGETYHGEFDSAEEAIEDSCCEVGSTVWIGETIPNTANHFVPRLSSFLESIEEAAQDECGECAEDWLCSLPAEATQQLQSALDAFADTLQRVAPPTFYRVRNAVEHVITDVRP